MFHLICQKFQNWIFPFALPELEASAQTQLHGLASQSEAAIDAAREKLTFTQAKVTQFQSLVKVGRICL